MKIAFSLSTLLHREEIVFFKDEILVTMDFHFKMWSASSVEIYRSVVTIGCNEKCSYGIRLFVIHHDFVLWWT